MRYYTSIFLLLFFLPGFSQRIDLNTFFKDIKKVDIDWPKVERKYNQAFTYKIVSDPTKIRAFCNQYENESGDSTFYSTGGFHWIDVNQDGFDDLIYSGGCHGLPEVDIYLTKKNTFKFLYGFGGLINSIKFKSDRTIIGVFLEANACLEFNALFELEIPKKTDIYKINSITSWHYNTKIDTITIFTNVHFLTKNLVDLRKEPILYNDSINSPCNDEVKMKGNVIATVKKGTKGILINKVTIAMVTWCLIMIEEKSIFKYGEKEKFDIVNRNIGWVTQKELDL